MKSFGFRWLCVCNFVLSKAQDWTCYLPQDFLLCSDCRLVKIQVRLLIVFSINKGSLSIRSLEY